VGNWILLNLFVAILISCLDTASGSALGKKQGSGAARMLLVVMTTVTPLKRQISQAMQETRRANPDPDPDPDLGPNPDPNPNPNLNPDPNPNPNPHTKPQPKPKTHPGPEPKT
jgi:hypothetical protein